jgi:hypothetical protein
MLFAEITFSKSIENLIRCDHRESTVSTDNKKQQNTITVIVTNTFQNKFFLLFALCYALPGKSVGLMEKQQTSCSVVVNKQ